VFLIAVIVAIAASYMMEARFTGFSAVVGPGKIYLVSDALIWREKDIDTPENIERLIFTKSLSSRNLNTAGLGL